MGRVKRGETYIESRDDIKTECFNINLLIMLFFFGPNKWTTQKQLMHSS